MRTSWPAPNLPQGQASRFIENIQSTQIRPLWLGGPYVLRCTRNQMLSKHYSSLNLGVPMGTRLRPWVWANPNTPILLSHLSASSISTSKPLNSHIIINSLQSHPTKIMSIGLPNIGLQFKILYLDSIVGRPKRLNYELNQCWINQSLNVGLAWKDIEPEGICINTNSTLNTGDLQLEM